jgi:hypothetical protein
MYTNVKSVHMYKSVKMTNVFFAVLQFYSIFERREKAKSFEHVVAANMFTHKLHFLPQKFWQLKKKVSSLVF